MTPTDKSEMVATPKTPDEGAMVAVLNTMIEKQRNERGDYLYHGEPDSYLVAARDRIVTLSKELAEAREGLTQSAADFDDLMSLARARIDDGDELGASVWRLALNDIETEAADNALRARKALSPETRT